MVRLGQGKDSGLTLGLTLETFRLEKSVWPNWRLECQLG